MKKVLLVLVVLFVAFGQTLLMYFWQDDFALIFKLMHQAEPMGSFGSGIIGEGPYKYLVTPYVPFFSWFGTNPFGYFFVGFITLIPVTFFFYKVAFEIFKNRSRAYLATLIFSSGYIGSDIMFRVINSWQTNIGLTLALVSLYLFVKYFRENKFKFYLVSLVIFYCATEFVYVRSHSLVFCFLVINLLFLFSKFKFKKVFNLILLQIPYWGIFYFKYLKDVPAGQSGIKNFIEQSLNFKFEYWAGLFGTIGNAIVPDYYQSKLLGLVGRQNLFALFTFVAVVFLLTTIAKLNIFQRLFLILGLPLLYLINENVFLKQTYWYNSHTSFLSVSIGLYISFISITIGVFLWRRNKAVAIGILSGFLFLVSQFFGYYIDYPTTIFTTTHRYLSYSAFGYAIFLISVFAIFEKGHRKIYLALVAIIVFSNLILGVTYQSRLVEDRSNATQKFYHDLVKFQPKVKKNAIFYFDIQSNNFVRGQFRDFFSVGSMPDSTALAIWYGLDRDEIFFVTDYDEFIYTLQEKGEIDNIYTFYYGKDGLKDTTNEMRQSLKEKSNFVGNYNEYTLSGKLTFTDMPLCINNSVNTKINTILNYLKDKEEYYKTVKVNAITQWRGQETEKVVDSRLDTSWRGHRIYWHDHSNESLVIDLGKKENINKLLWVNTNNTLTPTNYQVLVSDDLKDWKIVKEVQNGPELKKDQIVIETFESQEARYVKFNFLDTLSDDSPAISEIEVIKSVYSLDDINNSRDFVIDPLKFVDICAFKNLFNKFSMYVNVDAEFTSNKGKKVEEINLANLTKSSFKINSVVGGTVIEGVTINTRNMPVKYVINNFVSSGLMLDEIVQRNLITNFSRN